MQNQAPNFPLWLCLFPEAVTPDLEVLHQCLGTWNSVYSATALAVSQRQSLLLLTTEKRQSRLFPQLGCCQHSPGVWP